MRRAIAAWGLFLSLANGAWQLSGQGLQKGAAPDDRQFFPRNSIRGFVDFQVAPPHNEVDLGLCVLTKNDPLAQRAACSGYARYVWSGYLEMQPIGRGPLRHAFLFIEPKIFGGSNVPQERYSASASLILWEPTVGLGMELPKSFEFRLTHHQVNLLGRYRNNAASVSTLRTDGPYGINTTVGLRWYFGGWGHSSMRAQ